MSEFKDKFIAFIDILGFKKLVADTQAGVGMKLPELRKLLDSFGAGSERERFETHGPMCCPMAPYIDRNLDFRLTPVSDCVIVSAEVSPAGVINLVGHCWGAVIQLLQGGIMCRGYITRGPIYHTDKYLFGTGYQDAYLAEGKVSAFKREADERGTPFVEVDAAVCEYVEQRGDACVKEMFSRFVKRGGTTVALFPFQRLSHSFIVGGPGFDADKERRSNQNTRAMINRLKERVDTYVDKSNESAAQKASHYIAALDAQLEICDRTDEFIDMLGASSTARPGHAS